MSKVGRPASEKEKIIVSYQGKKYVVYVIDTTINGVFTKIPFVIDSDDYKRVSEIHWNRTGNYIGSKIEHAFTLLHRFILNTTFTKNNYVDHINRITFDNRKENLRIVTQSEQNWNQQKRKRNIILPENCGFTKDDVPTNVEYRHEYDGNYFKQYFEVVIKDNGIRVFREKTTKSKQVSLLRKLEEAKVILKNTEDEHPEWFEHRCVNGNLTEDGNKTYESYFEILKLANVVDPVHEYVEYEERNRQL